MVCWGGRKGMDWDDKKYGSYFLILRSLLKHLVKGSSLYVSVSWFLKWVRDHLAIIYFLGQKW